MRWQLQDAKARFSQVVRKALEEGPQVVTRHGEDAVVVLSAKEYRRLSNKPKLSAKDLLASAPLEGVDLERPRDFGREVEF